MRNAAVDRNQPEIVKAFRDLGFQVVLLHRVGQGCPDIACSLGAKTRFVEIKDGFKNRKLTKPQADFHRDWKDVIHVVYSVEDVIKIAEEW